jgi:hypothetical protein
VKNNRADIELARYLVLSHKVTPDNFNHAISDILTPHAGVILSDAEKQQLATRLVALLSPDVARAMERNGYRQEHCDSLRQDIGYSVLCAESKNLLQGALDVFQKCIVKSVAFVASGRAGVIMGSNPSHVR